MEMPVIQIQLDLYFGALFESLTKIRRTIAIAYSRVRITSSTKLKVLWSVTSRTLCVETVGKGKFDHFLIATGSIALHRSFLPTFRYLGR